MDCKEADKLLPLYVSDDLTESERAELDEHLAGCPACIEKVNLFREDRENIRTAFAGTEPDAGRDFFNGVLEKITRDNIERRGLVPWYMFSAAAAAVLVMSAILFSGLFTGPGEPLVRRDTPYRIDSRFIKTVDEKTRTLQFIPPARSVCKDSGKVLEDSRQREGSLGGKVPESRSKAELGGKEHRRTMQF